MFIQRDLEDRIRAGAMQAPIIAIIGPRQSGKSTLAKEIFKNHLYLDMQDAELFNFANQDPKGFLATYRPEQGVIIDEAQYAPALFGQLKVEVDKRPIPGYYILSGSQNFLLHEKIGESLAGRIYLYRLLPLSIKELKRVQLLNDRAEDQISKGFYPRVYQESVDAHEYYQNYISTYVERDIRMLKNIENISLFKKFMQLCALRVGTTINFVDLATSCGISVLTVKSWLGLLETSFILFTLPAYHENLGKRIIKTPKLYFYDVGLVSALTGVTADMIVKKRDIYGALFENMVLVDLIKNLDVHGVRYMLSFFRDNNKNEIDIIMQVHGRTVPIEVKASESIESSFFQTLLWFAEESNFGEKPILVYGGDGDQNRSKARVLSWKNVEKIVTQ